MAIIAFFITYFILDGIGFEKNSGTYALAVGAVVGLIAWFAVGIKPSNDTVAERQGPFHWDDKNRKICDTCSKLAYDSEDEADGAVRYMYRQHSFSSKSYHAKRCNYWHLTSG